MILLHLMLIPIGLAVAVNNEEVICKVTGETVATIGTTGAKKANALKDEGIVKGYFTMILSMF